MQREINRVVNSALNERVCQKSLSQNIKNQSVISHKRLTFPMIIVRCFTFDRAYMFYQTSCKDSYRQVPTNFGENESSCSLSYSGLGYARHSLDCEVS